MKTDQVLEKLEKIDKKLVGQDTKFDHVFNKLVGQDTKFDRVFSKLEEHDKKFDHVFNKLEEHSKKLVEHDGQLEVIAQTVFEHTERLDRIELKLEDVATKEDISKVMGSLDTIVGLYKKKDQELAMMGNRVGRVERDVERMKPLVGLA